MLGAYAEGGPERRYARYDVVRARLEAGMRPLGFEPIVLVALQAPIYLALRSERHGPDAAAFASYYATLRRAGLLVPRRRAS